jgi:hypothetical protein
MVPVISLPMIIANSVLLIGLWEIITVKVSATAWTGILCTIVVWTFRFYSLASFSLEFSNEVMKSLSDKNE